MDKWLIDNPRKEFFLEREKINKTCAVKLPIWSERISWVTTNSKCHLYLCPRKFVQVLIPNEIILIKVWRDFLKHSNCWSALTRTLSVRNATVSERNNLISRKYCEFLQKMITSIVMCNAKGMNPYFLFETIMKRNAWTKHNLKQTPKQLISDVEIHQDQSRIQ